MKPIGHQPKDSEGAFFVPPRRETRKSPRPAKHPYDPCKTLIFKKRYGYHPFYRRYSHDATRHDVT